jgi:hypothetical protein
MGRPCSTHGGLGMHTALWRESQKRPLGRTRRERIILKWISEKWCEGVDWIDLPQNMDQRRSLVNTVMKLRAP